MRALAGPDVSVHAELFSPFSQFMDLVGYTEGLMALLIDAGRAHAVLELRPLAPQLIDARTRRVLQERVGSAEATLASARAQLAQAQAAAARAKLEADRARQLAADQFLSDSARDEAATEEFLRHLGPAGDGAEPRVIKMRVGRSRRSRITSYNVCYTKLLRGSAG